jgi:beta-glucosidase
LQEVLEKAGLPNQAQTLAESLGSAFVFGSVDPPGAPKRYGNAILTPHRLVTTHEVHLEPLDDYRVAVHARVAIGDRDIDADATHLHHTAEGGAIRATQIRSPLEFVDRTRGAAGLVVGGDFNAAPGAPEMRLMHERFMDSVRALHLEQPGMLVSTLNPAKGHAPQRIDYIFAGAGSLQPVVARIVLATPAANGVWASDHFGMWTAWRWTRPPAPSRSGERRSSQGTVP